MTSAETRRQLCDAAIFEVIAGDMTASPAEAQALKPKVVAAINQRTTQAVIDGAAQRGQEIKIGGQLYPDALGEAGTPGGNRFRGALRCAGVVPRPGLGPVALSAAAGLR